MSKEILDEYIESSDGSISNLPVDVQEGLANIVPVLKSNLSSEGLKVEFSNIRMVDDPEAPGGEVLDLKIDSGFESNPDSMVKRVNGLTRAVEDTVDSLEDNGVVELMSSMSITLEAPPESMAPSS